MHYLVRYGAEQDALYPGRVVHARSYIPELLSFGIEGCCTAKVLAARATMCK